MCCVNRSDSGVFPPASGKPLGCLHGREEEKMRKKKKVVLLITTAARWQTCDLVGCCSRAVAHVKLICVPTLKPASSDLGQTSRFSRLRSLDRKPFRWIRRVTHHHQLLPAPLASVVSALLPFVTLFPFSPDFLVSRRPESAGFTSIPFAPCFYISICSPCMFSFQITKSRNKGKREDEGGWWKKVLSQTPVWLPINQYYRSRSTSLFSSHTLVCLWKKPRSFRRRERLVVSLDGDECLKQHQRHMARKAQLPLI